MIPVADASIAPAPRTAIVVTALTLATVAAAFAVALSLPWRVFIALIALAVGGLSLVNLLRPRWRRMRIDGDRIVLECRSGRRLTGLVSGRPFVSPVYIGLRWHGEGGRLPRPVGIFREQMRPDDYRRLCVALRFPGMS